MLGSTLLLGQSALNAPRAKRSEFTNGQSHNALRLLNAQSTLTYQSLLLSKVETAYRDEVKALGVWCLENNLSLNVSKRKEMIVDFRKQQRVPPLSTSSEP
jgi:hypothetical protein